MNKDEIIQHVYGGCTVRTLNGKVTLIIPWNAGQGIYHELSLCQFKSIRHSLMKVCTNGESRFYRLKG